MLKTATNSCQRWWKFDAAARGGATIRAWHIGCVEKRDMHAALLSLVLTVGSADALPPLPADNPPPHQPLTRADVQSPPPHEYGLAAGQFLAGMGAALGGVFLAPLHPALLAGVPLLVGYTVCQVGKMSDYYESHCGPAILGAYLGALTILPLAWLGMSLDHSTDGEIDGLGGILIGALVGWAVVQPLSATLAARMFKAPKPVYRTMAPVGLPRMPPPVRGQVTISILSLAW
jgi:hypothetical protein